MLIVDPATSFAADRQEHDVPDLAETYLDLLRDTLTRRLVANELYAPARPHTTLRKAIHAALQFLLSRSGLVLARPVTAVDPAEHWVWPTYGETMVSIQRLDSLRSCIKTVCLDQVPGDLVETGAWRGGSSIFMRGALLAYGDTLRKVWVADSFQGVPPPDIATYPLDEGADFSTYAELAVSVKQVKANFSRYGLLDDRVEFLQGWFKDTLPSAPIAEIAVLRLDGDLYESTAQALDALYSRISPGGYCVVDDYNAVHGCQAAVNDFRASQGITAEIVRIDNFAVFWRIPGTPELSSP